MKRIAVAMALIAGVGTLAGCSGSSPDSGSKGGTIILATGKDTTHKWQSIIDQGWNANHKVKVKLQELSDKADEQRNSMVQVFQAKNSRYDIVNMDVIWTPEFAAKGWITDLPKSDFKIDDYLPATVDSASWRGKLYAAPFTSDGGMLFYRKDLVSTPPATWDELIQDCSSIAKPKGIGCYAGQYSQYEGLTVNFDEAVRSAGGEILSDDGKTVKVDSSQAKAGLDFLVNGFKQGYIPKDAIGYQEEQSRTAFQQGQLLFLRNWPYVYGNAIADPNIKDKFAIAPLPKGPGGKGVSSLGGHNLAVSKFSKHQKDAIEFLKWMTGKDGEKPVTEEMTLAPTIASLYDDPALQAKLPYLSTLKKSIESAAPRPKTPVYNDVTQVIELNAYAALQGSKSPDQALKDMASQLKAKIKE